MCVETSEARSPPEDVYPQCSAKQLSQGTMMDWAVWQDCGCPRGWGERLVASMWHTEGWGKANGRCRKTMESRAVNSKVQILHAVWWARGRMAKSMGTRQRLECALEIGKHFIVWTRRMKTTVCTPKHSFGVPRDWLCLAVPGVLLCNFFFLF